MLALKNWQKNFFISAIHSPTHPSIHSSTHTDQQFYFELFLNIISPNLSVRMSLSAWRGKHHWGNLYPWYHSLADWHGQRWNLKSDSTGCQDGEIFTRIKSVFSTPVQLLMRVITWFMLLTLMNKIPNLNFFTGGSTLPPTLILSHWIHLQAFLNSSLTFFLWDHKNCSLSALFIRESHMSPSPYSRRLMSSQYWCPSAASTSSA